jgi:tetratricopeptide (TPR) repeat protein
MSFCHDAIGSLALDQHDYALAREHYRAASILRTEAKDAEGIARAQLGLGMVACYQRDYAAARQYLTDALSGLRRVHSLGGIASSLNFLGRVAVAELDYNAAKTHFLEALQTLRQLDAARSLLPLLLSISELFCQAGHVHRGKLFITWVIEHPASGPALRSEARTLLSNVSGLAKNLPSDTDPQPLVAPVQPLSNLTLLIPTLIDELTNLAVPLPDNSLWR